MDALVKKVEGDSGAKPPTRLAKALKKPTGAPTFVVEFARDKGLAPHKVDDASLMMRRSKVAMIIVDTSVDDQGPVDVESFVKEQATAKGNFPGPAGIVWRGNIKTIEDVARAAAYGCQGVAISFEDAGEKAEELIKACFAVDVEAVVEVRT